MPPLVEEVFVGHGLKLHFGYECWYFESTRQNDILIDYMTLWAIKDSSSHVTSRCLGKGSYYDRCHLVNGGACDK